MADSMTVTLAHKSECHSSGDSMWSYYVWNPPTCKQKYHVATLNALWSDIEEFAFRHEELSLPHCAINGLRKAL